MPTHTRPRAFTLIELLTVIAIVGIMAAITIPVVGKVRESANNVQCLSALRSWGIALQLYVDEHKGMLPGPCWAVVENLPSNNRQLPYFLAPYMNSTLKKGKLPDNFLCRAWAHDRTKEDTAIWQLVRVAKRAGGSGIRPFGYPNSDTEPVRNYHTLDDIINIRTAIAIRDIDKGVASNDGLPEKPVHKNHRNVLFFDWHVGTEAAN
ncbi:type II secretion system protein [Geminisphaera colitermitum]|uniref:type II secretion system protein n=1 Tax=Geminisphaera colitermitum TaxID=1148786 RepID=UPI0001965445|nr:type II secretion system protein [Geminisphaera colitermitum]